MEQNPAALGVLWDVWAERHVCGPRGSSLTWNAGAGNEPGWGIWTQCLTVAGGVEQRTAGHTLEVASVRKPR